MPEFDGPPYTQLTTPARGDIHGVIKDISEPLPENQTKFATQEDLHQFGSWASKVRKVTASGSVTLLDTDPQFIEIDPNGSNRDVNFPAASDNNHGYYILHSGSANTLTLKRSGGATITTLEAGEVKYIMPSALEDFNAQVGGGGVGGGLSVSIASVTTSNVTGVEDTHHILNVGGMTANRDFNLPTPTAAGKRCKVTLSVGDDTYALIVKRNSVEVARIFITNETLEYVSTGTGAGDWQLAQNGMIKNIAILERTTAQSIASADATEKVEFNSAPANIGAIADIVTNFRVTIRRAGVYEIGGFLAIPGIDDGENVQCRIYIDGSFVDYAIFYSPAADRAPTAIFTKKYNLTVGQYVEMYAYHTEGGAQNTDTTYKPQLTVEEVTGSGGAGGGGGGGDLLASNNLSDLSSIATALTNLLAVPLPENTAIQLDAVLSADGKYSGVVLPSQTAGATLAFGDLVYLVLADSRWELADADAAATAGGVILGMCVLAAAGDGDPTTILLFGKIRADAAFPTLTVGAPVYVGTTAGDVQVAAPSGSADIVRIIGHALTADELLFRPSNDWIEIA